MTCSRTPAGATRAASIGRRAAPDLEDDDVGLDAGAVDRDAVDRRQPLGQPARVGVIVGEARAVVVERVQRAGAQHADLAHAAAQHLAEAARALRCRRACRPATEPTGAPSPFEKHADTVSNGRRQLAAPACRWRRRRSRCARRRGAAPARARARAPRPRSTAARGQMRPPPRLCVFSSAHQARARQVAIGGQRRRRRARRRSNVPSARADLGELHAGPRRAGARLVERACARRAPTITSSPGRQCTQQRDLVGHRAAGHEQRRLLAQQRPRRAPPARAPSDPRPTRRRRPRPPPSPRASPASAS